MNQVELGLSGRVAVITGSGRGIGLVTARMFAQEGVRVVVTDIDGLGAEASAAKLREEGFEAAGVACDVTKREDTEALAAFAIRHFGQIDILVNNAAVARDKSILKMEETEWDLVVDTVLKGAFQCSRAVLPHMYQRRWGRIVNITSRSLFGNPGQTNHSSAKAGLVGFTRALSLEQAKNGITVNAVAPGFIETEGMRDLPHYPQLREAALAKNPVGFLGEPHDIGNAVLFMASQAARYISGTTLFVTGGRYSS